jgi:hypothetical protein
MTLLGILGLLTPFVATPTLAQQARDEVELTRPIIQTEVELIVASTLGLTDRESEAF